MRTRGRGILREGTASVHSGACVYMLGRVCVCVCVNGGACVCVCKWCVCVYMVCVCVHGRVCVCTWWGVCVCKWCVCVHGGACVYVCVCKRWGVCVCKWCMCVCTRWGWVRLKTRGACRRPAGSEGRRLSPGSGRRGAELPGAPGAALTPTWRGSALASSRLRPCCGPPPGVESLPCHCHSSTGP